MAACSAVWPVRRRRAPFPQRRRTGPPRRTRQPRCREWPVPGDRRVGPPAGQARPPRRRRGSKRSGWSPTTRRGRLAAPGHRAVKVATDAAGPPPSAFLPARTGPRRGCCATGVVGLDFQRTLVMRNCLVDSPASGQAVGEAVMGRSVVRLGFQGCLVVGNGLVNLSAVGQQKTQIAVRLRVVGRDLQRLEEMGDGLVELRYPEQAHRRGCCACPRRRA